MSEEKERVAKAEAAIAKITAELEAAERKLTAYVESLGIAFKPPEALKQRGLEEMMRAVRKHGGSEADISNYERNGAQARAACELGWIDGLTVANVDTMNPRVVTWIAQQTNDIIVAAWELPGE
jgi:hypothetical protein